ncbi:MAG: hypothetical protein GWN58_07885, partial [Anaerolineae bacterium]|nr:hypothetical protein [Anaerolineae bacterium]
MLAYTNAVVRWMAGWPLASIEIDGADASWIVLAYTTLLLLLWAWTRRREAVGRVWSGLTTRRSSLYILGGAAVVAILAWLAVLQLPDRKLHVAFLDVGQGDAIIITT